MKNREVAALTLCARSPCAVTVRSSGEDAREPDVGEPKTPNTVFRELREREWRSSRTEAARMIRKKAIELGEPVECDARTISLWEDGTTACPRPIYQRVLYAMTGRDPEQLGFTPLRRGRRPARRERRGGGNPRHATT